MAKQTFLVPGIALVITGAIAFAIYQSRQPAATPPAPPPATIAAAEITTENWEPTLNSVGSLVAQNGINVSTEVSGIVSELAFSSGQSVSQGDVLVRLDLDVDKASLEALRAERKLARIQYNRASDLLKKKVTSKSEFDETQANYEAADARVRQQEAVIRRKVIRAPFDGLAGIRKVNLGQYVEAGDPLVSLQALDPIYVDYTLPERYLSRIQNGQQVNIKLDALPGQSFTGKISALDSGIDTGTRTLKVRATLSNPDNIMRPGMFAQVQTITGAAQAVLTLPRTAISFNTYGNFVFVINTGEDGKLTVKRTAVKTGDAREGRVKVAGLPAGTQVVRTGLVKLRDGMQVSIDNQVKLEDAGLEGE